MEILFLPVSSRACLFSSLPFRLCTLDEMPDAQPSSRVRRRATEACTFCRKRKVTNIFSSPFPIFPILLPYLPPLLLSLPLTSWLPAGLTTPTDQVQRPKALVHQLPDIRERMRLRARA